MTMKMSAGVLTKALIAALALAAVLVAAPRGAVADTTMSIEKIRERLATMVTSAVEKLGGSRVVFKVDAAALRDEMVTELRDNLYQTLKEGRIPFSGLTIRDGGVEVRIADPKDRARVAAKLVPAKSADKGAEPSPIGATDAGDGLLRLAPTDAAFDKRLHDLVGQSIGMIEQRLADVGVKLGIAQPDGPDRIRVVIPGLSDPQRIVALFDKKVRVSIRLVDISMSPDDALHGSPPAGSEVLYGFKDKTPYLVLKDSALDGEDIRDVMPGIPSDSEKPIVNFRFNAHGTRRLAHITAENIGRPFAIVLNDQVISAPVIREPIVGGSGQISGDFTPVEANSIAMKLLAGALPGRLSVVEQQVIAPAVTAGKQ
jgi:preprotein translocase subunit SecD